MAGEAQYSHPSKSLLFTQLGQIEARFLNESPWTRKILSLPQKDILYVNFIIKK